MAEDQDRVVTALASTLKSAREKHGWTQRRLATEAARAGHELSGAYVGLIEAGRRIPTVAVVRALAEVLEQDADELVRLRSQAEFERIVSSLEDKRLSDVDPETLARGRERVHEFLARQSDQTLTELKRLEEARGTINADIERSLTEISAAAQVASAWMSVGGGPRRGRRYELTTRLFELVGDLEAEQIQRVIGYTEAVREERRTHASD